MNLTRHEIFLMVAATAFMLLSLSFCVKPDRERAENKRLRECLRMEEYKYSTKGSEAEKHIGHKQTTIATLGANSITYCNCGGSWTNY